jgi:hypothetical protein
MGAMAGAGVQVIAAWANHENKPDEFCDPYAKVVDAVGRRARIEAEVRKDAALEWGPPLRNQGFFLDPNEAKIQAEIERRMALESTPKSE